MTVLLMRNSGLQLPGRRSLQISDQCVLFINQLIDIYGTRVTWKAPCQLMLNTNMHAGGGEYKALQSLESIKLHQLVVNPKIASGIQRTEKGIPGHRSLFQFLLFVDEPRAGDVSWK